MVYTDRLAKRTNTNSQRSVGQYPVIDSGTNPLPTFAFWALSRPAPAHALVIDDLVFIAGGNWLGSILQPQPEATDFGFAIESREFAENLRACFVAAEEVCRYRA